MSKVICNRIEIIPASDVDLLYADQIKLKKGKEFSNLPLEGQVEYSSQSSNPDAGSLLTETITAKIKNQKGLTFLTTGIKYFIIRLYTDDGSFLVGSLDYPAEMTYRDNKIHVNLAFKAVKPL